MTIERLKTPGLYTVVIQPSPTADTRTCDPSTVSMKQLWDSSQSHCEDVRATFDMLRHAMDQQACEHDDDKFTGIKTFHAEFQGGFQETTWWDAHRKANRHHLNAEDGVPEDVNLIDVIEYLVDCVVAGKARTVTVRPVEISPDVLMRAFQNMVKLVDKHTEVQR